MECRLLKICHAILKGACNDGLEKGVTFFQNSPEKGVSFVVDGPERGMS